MKNIFDIFQIKSINIEKATEDVKEGSGTFKELLDDVYAGKIIPLITNNNIMYGISYDAGAASIIEDNIEQLRFEKRYAFHNIIRWVLKALEIKDNNKVVANVIENEDEIKVICEDGEEIEIESYVYNYEDPDDDSELPSDLDIDIDKLEDMSEKSVKQYLRDTYGRYLARGNKLEIEYDEAEKCVLVDNIKWGRKI